MQFVFDKDKLISVLGMTMNLKDKIEYIVVVVGEFARINNLSMPAAFEYLKKYRGLEIIDDGYEIEHTFSIETAVEDITKYCRRFGGTI